MTLHRITQPTDTLFEAVWALYLTSFPACERRSLADHLAAMTDGAFHACAALDGDRFVGLAFFWQTEDFLYLEHVAIRPELRGGGLGAQLLRTLQALQAQMILEIDFPEDDVSRRRKGFYERLGLTAEDFGHFQYPYQAGTEGVPLLIMSRPAITAAQYETFHDFFLHRVLSYTPNRF